MNVGHCHTIGVYIYIYIYRERERDQYVRLRKNLGNPKDFVGSGFCGFETRVAHNLKVSWPYSHTTISSLIATYTAVHLL